MGHRLQQSVKTIKKKTDQKGAKLTGGKKKKNEKDEKEPEIPPGKKKKEDQKEADIPASKEVGAKKQKSGKSHQRESCKYHNLGIHIFLLKVTNKRAQMYRNESY